MDAQPIFIHSLFRAGSTYFFNVFRRSPENYWCYQEPLHEVAFMAKENPENLLQFHSEKMQHLRHPALDKPYFQELYETLPHWVDILSREAIYDNYFGLQNDNAIEYLSALIKHAKGRAVIQDCRTSNRIHFLKKALGGTHIYLCRNPWDQWWSYKSTDYFNAVSHLIVTRESCPPVIQRLRDEYKLNSLRDENIYEEVRAYHKFSLTPEATYAIFYTLWCLALCEARKHADLVIEIDRLSILSPYRNNILDQLATMGVNGIDINDCQSPQAHFMTLDSTFFQDIEVHERIPAPKIQLFFKNKPVIGTSEDDGGVWKLRLDSRGELVSQGGWRRAAESYRRTRNLQARQRRRGGGAAAPPHAR
jgi:hypothetical protein